MIDPAGWRGGLVDAEREWGKGSTWTKAQLSPMRKFFDKKGHIFDVDEQDRNVTVVMSVVNNKPKESKV